MPPRTIAGRYLVDRAVGRGGMGTVWLCRDEVLGRQVAVKQIGALPGETTFDVARALREARSSAALNHPHVVAIYDAVEDETGNWLVMEYVPSRTLAEIVAQEGPLDPVRVAGLGAQAAEGLAAAHARGTVHRDVKPSNLLITDDDHVKITDFGISRTHGDVELTRTGLVTGTPSYLSPEAARGESGGTASDVWALGATLWTAVEGVGPYADRDNALAVLNAIVSEPTPVPQHGGPLTDDITRMMDHDPGTRPSMGAVVASLQAVRRGDPAPAAAAAAAPAVVPVAAPVDPAPPPAQPTEERSRRGRGGWLVAAAVLLVLLLGGVVWQLGRDEAQPVAGTTDPTPSPSATPSETPTEEPTPTQEPETSAPPSSTAPPPEPEPSSPSPTESESESTEPEPTGDAAAFATSYYAQLPDNLEAAYSQLSPSYRSSTSFESYAGFWRTVDAVSVGSTTVADDGTTVDVQVTYTTDGSSQTETRRLYLDPAGDGFVIGDDEAV
ncbi:serine/threonine-protein kinase [Nocardioides sp. AX2bis]|uniref:serine/threonine-protein kinase n=1 Tax=Nocardioides sp. AX2bis TaxID=2653157 RepID=UPI0012F101E9|nr:serine/threonine-protein kinase [Nocardioides sp. AX2bis]VXC44907.1 Serine/threonine protein kinase [Nocardioides sp. AX2bis]